MSAITKIHGSTDSLQTSPVENSTRPAREIEMEKSTKNTPESSLPKDLEQANQDNRDGVSSKTVASYEETKAVADKIQSRINELVEVPHQVSIHNDEETHQFVILIKDSDGKVVKQFPSEKVLNLHARLDDLSGMIIDEMI